MKYLFISFIFKNNYLMKIIIKFSIFNYIYILLLFFCSLFILLWIKRYANDLHPQLLFK